MEIWPTLQDAPDSLISWYQTRYKRMRSGKKTQVYEAIKASHNAYPNGADLLLLCRSCYGGIVRFRKRDGHMSTPCGVHQPINPASFADRVREWKRRTTGTTFLEGNFEEVIDMTNQDDLVYCDPPYLHSQTILYGAQNFNLTRLFTAIARAKDRNVRIARSIDGTNKSGNVSCDLPISEGLFEKEAFVNCGPSMLRRFQKSDKSLEDEIVSDRLLLTY